MMNTKDWVVPNAPSICQYHPENLSQDPHRHRKWQGNTGKLTILPSILHTIHNTPLIRINNITKKDGIECEVLAKCEFFSAGGSVKDRIGLRMVEDAEEKGILRKGSTIIEPTSGNTGIGIALTACVKGYKSVIVIPEKMSKEKIDILKGLGAEIVQTPTSASFSSEKSNFGMSAKLLEERPKSHVFNQFRNAANAMAHYDNTAEEILDACGDNLDMVVSSIGTGGTLTGIARKVKEKLPNCKILATDPVGSLLAFPDSLNEPGLTFYEMEGIGSDFIPTILNRKLVDHWCKVTDKEAFHMARRLIREEGLLCVPGVNENSWTSPGGSSGAAMHCALKTAKELGLGKEKRVVVIMPDSIRNYLTKFVKDDWLRVRGLLEGQSSTEIASLTWWRRNLVKELKIIQIKTVPSTMKLRDALKSMTVKTPICAVEMVSKSTIIGTLTGKLAMREVLAGKNDTVLAAVANDGFKQVSTTDTLANLSVLFQYEEEVLVFDTKNERKRLLGMVNKGCLVAYICKPMKRSSKLSS